MHSQEAHQRQALGMNELATSYARQHAPSWNGTFDFLRPRWQTLMQFLELCCEFDGSEDEAGAHTDETVQWIRAISPLFSLRGPSFYEATKALDAYAHATQMQSKSIPHDAGYTCLPWSYGFEASHLDGLRTRSAPRIAMATLFTAHLRNMSAVALALGDKQEYCERHGYDFHTITQTVSGRDAAWAKLPGILSLLHRYDWVVSLDLDTIIYDHSVRLEEFLDPNHDLILGVDYNGINSGVFFLRSSTWSRALLTEAWTITDEPMSHIWWEQSALMRLLKNEGVRNHVKYCPQMYFNSYVASNEGVKMEENGNRGPFIVHFAGLGTKWEILPKFHAQRRNTRQTGNFSNRIAHFEDGREQI